MHIADALIAVFIRDAQADHRRFAEVRFVFCGVGEMLEDVTVQITKVIRDAKTGLVFIMV
ncbi:hypothetical protein D3C75_1022460 [compost metagenome]